MRKILFLLILSSIIMFQSNAQDLPLKEIPSPPDTYSAGNVLARMVEGFGFRYYWATEGLREQDLAYKPAPDARSCRETIDHILNLTEGVYYTSIGKKIKTSRNAGEMTVEEVRKQSLENLSKAAANFRALSDEEVAELKIKFGSGRGFDLWFLINGQISDGIYHTGQIVSFRRSTGNPINPKVSVFTGKLRE